MSNIVRDLTDALRDTMAESACRRHWCNILLELVKDLARDRQPSEYQLDKARAILKEYAKVFP